MIPGIPRPPPEGAKGAVQGHRGGTELRQGLTASAPRPAAAQCLPSGLPSLGLALGGPSRSNCGRLVSGGSGRVNPRGLLTRAWSRAERLGAQGVRGRDTEIHRLRTRPRKGGEGSPGRAAGLAPTAAVRTASLPAVPSGDQTALLQRAGEGTGAGMRGMRGLGAGLWNAAAGPTFASRRLGDPPRARKRGREQRRASGDAAASD